MVSAISMSCYVAKVWSANQSPHFSDLYAPWWAAHELFLRGRSPYRPEVAHEIQAVIYGAPRMAGYPGDDSALAGGFAYPLYAASLLWPTVRMSFPAVEKMFFCVSVLAVLASLACWLRALRFHPPPVQWLTIAFLVFGSFPVLQGLKLENLSLIAAALLAVTMVLLSTDHLILAGLFMAASTFKPQFTIVLIPWLVCWISSDWRRRRALAWSFLATMLLLIGGSELLMPGWIGDFLRIVGHQGRSFCCRRVAGGGFRALLAKSTSPGKLGGFLPHDQPYAGRDTHSHPDAGTALPGSSAAGVLVDHSAPHLHLGIKPIFPTPLCLALASIGLALDRGRRFDTRHNLASG